MTKVSERVIEAVYTISDLTVCEYQDILSALDYYASINGGNRRYEELYKAIKEIK